MSLYDTHLIILSSQRELRALNMHRGGAYQNRSYQASGFCIRSQTFSSASHGYDTNSKICVREYSEQFEVARPATPYRLQYHGTI